ncbi:diguanylate cyclase domain-containing protein [Arcobacter sp. YIC-464]|uniref:diguanylate cyclase domain-containing protein n=1 Tax=Arcobacter sp. YIC-464 TaxID=3376631 RepID=UPI003C1C5EA0
MKKELRRITNLTLNELLNNEIIMPSVYFEKFNKNAKTLEIDFNDEKFNKEINELILEDFNTIENYMDIVASNASELKKVANDTKKAIENKDEDALSQIYKHMNSLEEELERLNKKIFLDDLTTAYNRKWLYNQFLNENALFKDDGIISMIDLVDYDYVQNEYGDVISNNLLIFICNFLKKHLDDDKCDFEIVRFLNNKFIVIFKDKTEKDAKSLINNIKRLLANSTLKSKSGIVLKANFNYKVKAYEKGTDSKELFEALLS